MPAWRDISPAKIAKQLPIIWSYAYDPAQDEFIGRLGGEAINRIFGRNIKGAKLSGLDSIIGKERLIQRAKRVITMPALFRGYEPMFWQSDSHGVGERIVMPLATDGITADGILGATDYHIEGYVASDAENIVTAEDWFVIP